MIKTIAIKSKNTEPLLVTWDILRRCNLDCSYCESNRHNNYSELPSLESMVKTFYFIKQYSELYNDKRPELIETCIDFTGGEPTINPAFWPLIEEIKTHKGFRLTLTTNGTWGPNFTQKILDNFSHVTVSWHAEDDLKHRTLKNILDLAKAGISLQANVMLHCDYFDEAKEVCELLKSNGVRVHPTPIGDGNILYKGWFIDQEGHKRRTTHEYTEEQQNWFYKFIGLDTKSSAVEEGTKIGRACCGGRCTQGLVDNQWQDVKLVHNFFKDWYCTVNWYFLHINQQEGKVYHHQTCQARFDGIGPIGDLADTDSILTRTKTMLDQPMTAIICPNQRCGCGMCVPKARDKDTFQILWKNTTKVELV